LLGGCTSGPETTQVDYAQKAHNPRAYPDQWMFRGGNFEEQHFSPLDQINKANINQLGLAWSVDLPRDGGQEATPLMIDGVLYFSTAWSRVYAVDAHTGELIWKYDPEVSREAGFHACCGPVSRGVAYWDGKVYVASFDGRLIALDAQNGTEVWTADTFKDVNNYSTNHSYTITGAPRVAGKNVIIGNGGSEYGVRGFVTAYDLETGKRTWRFYTVPGDPAEPFENPILEEAVKTWNGEWWKVGGGGTAWDAMPYDPALNLVYIGVGNGSPWNPKLRSDGEGDNLFLSSIVAVNADNGEYVWHYQTTPGDGWDFTASQPIIMANLKIKGEQRQVLMQAPKNGFFYVLDRATGELLSAEPFSKVNWASHVDMETGRPVVEPEAKYWKTGKPFLQWPGPVGAHNWHPMAYSPVSGLVYIPETEFPNKYESVGDDFKFNPIGRNQGLKIPGTQFPKDKAILDKIVKSTFKGSLVAWDPVTQKEVWRLKQEWAHAGGVLATQSDLIFQGTVEGKLKAMDAMTGEVVWDFDAKTAIMAAPMSYRINDMQYIAVLVGRGGALMGGRRVGDLNPENNLINRSRLLVFKLGGQAQLPMDEDEQRVMQDLSQEVVPEGLIAEIAPIYGRQCQSCHGFSAVGNSITPDLRYSPYLRDSTFWYNVVGEGSLAKKGMVGLKSILTAEEIEKLRKYVIHHNQQSRAYGDTLRIGR